MCMFCRSLFDLVCPFVLFLVAIMLSVLLQYTASDYPLLVFQNFLKRERRYFIQVGKIHNV